MFDDDKNPIAISFGNVVALYASPHSSLQLAYSTASGMSKLLRGVELSVCRMTQAAFTNHWSGNDILALKITTISAQTLIYFECIKGNRTS